MRLGLGDDLFHVEQIKLKHARLDRRRLKAEIDLSSRSIWGDFEPFRVDSGRIRSVLRLKSTKFDDDFEVVLLISVGLGSMFALEKVHFLFH